MQTAKHTATPSLNQVNFNNEPFGLDLLRAQSQQPFQKPERGKSSKMEREKSEKSDKSLRDLGNNNMMTTNW